MSRAVGVERGIDRLSAAAESMRRAANKANREDAKLAALLVGGLVLALRDRSVDVAELRTIIVQIAAWKPRG